MKKKTGILVITFILFYAMIHLGRYLPDLYTGRFSLVDERSYTVRTISLLADMLASSMFTLSTYFILYCCYPQKKYITLIFMLISTFLAGFVISYFVAVWDFGSAIRLSRYFRNNILYGALYTILAFVFYFIRYSQFKELQQRELAIQNRDAELSFLRSQINPHFLFNNLNNIYSLVYHHSDQSLSAISGLSELLRHMLYDTNETISLEKEINCIEKYIALEQLRFETPCLLTFSCTGDLAQIQMPPLLLIPFIENAFKHGAISFNHAWLNISIHITPDDQLELYCANEVGIKTKDNTGGIGIENVRKRLALLYPSNHTLDIKQEMHKFIVHLKLGYYPAFVKKTANEIS